MKLKKDYFFMVGAPGSGKSTFSGKLASETGALIVCPDHLRDVYPDKSDAQIFAIAREIIAFTLKNGKRDVILDCTNTSRRGRKEMIEAGKSFANRVVCIHMVTSLEESLKRHKDRQAKGEKPTLTEERITEMYNRLQNNLPDLTEGFDEIIER